MRPGLREYTSLMDACKRAAQPALAAHVMHHVLPEQGLVPDTQAWNALLGAYGRNGDMDSAYATWQVCAPCTQFQVFKHATLCSWWQSSKRLPYCHNRRVVVDPVSLLVYTLRVGGRPKDTRCVSVATLLRDIDSTYSTWQVCAVRIQFIILEKIKYSNVNLYNRIGSNKYSIQNIHTHSNSVRAL